MICRSLDTSIVHFSLEIHSSGLAIWCIRICSPFLEDFMKRMHVCIPNKAWNVSIETTQDEIRRSKSHFVGLQQQFLLKWKFRDLSMFVCIYRNSEYRNRSRAISHRHIEALYHNVNYAPLLCILYSFYYMNKFFLRRCDVIVYKKFTSLLFLHEFIIVCRS